MGATVTVLASLVAVPSAASSEFECDGQTATIVGTGRNDVIVGTDGPDVIVGRGDADIIDGGAGDDVICGGRGDDNLRGGKGADRIFGQQNIAYGDTLDGGPGDDLIDGGRGPWYSDDTLVFLGSGSGVTFNARRHTADGISSGHDQVFGVAEVWGTRL